MSGLWQQDIRDCNASDELHAGLHYEDVVAAGPACRPLDFPAPTIFRSEFVAIQARDHRSGTIHNLKRILIRSHAAGEKPSDTAYLITKKLGKSVYGSVRLCVVLKRLHKEDHRNSNGKGAKEDRQDDDDGKNGIIEWESTDDLAVVKISEWKKMHAMRGKHLEDPINEISSMQLLGNYHPHVIGALECLQDNDCLYTVTPYLGGGDVYSRLLEFVGPRSAAVGNGTFGFDEGLSRTWFNQLLQSVDHLQKKGVCHRDICLENLLIDSRNDKICLIDLGMSLRVPYTDPYGGGISDVSAGTSRRLMITQGLGGKLMYAAPEIIAKEDSVDAFATDMWSVGCVLFVMLVGLAPFKWAHPSDKRYEKISQGGLSSLIEALEISLSPEACDLLQGFFWADPRRRLTLREVMQHPWVQGKKFSLRPMTLPNISSRQFNFGSKDVKTKHAAKKIFGSIQAQIHPELNHHHIHMLSPQS